MGIEMGYKVLGSTVLVLALLNLAWTILLLVHRLWEHRTHYLQWWRDLGEALWEDACDLFKLLPENRW